MSVQRLIVERAERIGRDRFVAVCVALLGGAPRERYVEELRALTGHAWNPGDAVFGWPDCWGRVWGARGLLHVWDDAATEAVVAGLADPHWRPAETCLKVVAQHEVVGAGDGATVLARHALPRVRAQAVRCLASVGDSEHAEAIRAALSDADAEVRRQARRALGSLEERLGGIFEG